LIPQLVKNFFKIDYDDIRKNFWDEIRDSKINGIYNIEFKEDNTLKSASLVKIIEILTSPEELEANFLETFLHTYRSFTTPEILLTKLIERFNTPELSPYKDKTQKGNKKILFF
jgi:son of sevenless-like protein